jgi:dTDP-4-dehydrorhamnose reductase
MQHVVILGASGMLGSMLVDALAREGCFRLSATVRSQADLALLQCTYPAVAVRLLDAETCSDAELVEAIGDASWVINAIGLIKQRIVDGDDALVERAVRINTLFSFVLSRAAEKTGARVIQVATDCVYSGTSRGYDETALHDCLDVYGRTKSLGEVGSEVVCNLRCSIIGFERKSSLSLLNWFLSQERNATVNGFTDHVWNGVTTLHFAKICRGVITNGLRVPSRQHVVPEGVVTKDELLRLFAEAFGREDIRINPVRSSGSVNRTLLTNNPDMNRAMWEAAGYPRQPSIRDMVFELARYREATNPDIAAATRNGRVAL